MLLFLAIIITFCGATHSLDLIVVDQAQRMEVSLQKYFNHSLENDQFIIDQNQSRPLDIEKYFSFEFLKQFYPITSVQMTEDGFHLNQHKILQTLSITTQPIKLFLTPEVVMMVLFDDQLKDKSIMLSTLNISKSSNKKLMCKHLSFDNQNYRLYIQCKDTVKNQPITVLLSVQRDFNHIVSSIKYVKDVSTSGYLKECQQRRILYLSSIILINKMIVNEIMLYCPRSKNNAQVFTAISFSADLQDNFTIHTYDLNGCPSSCCYAAEQIFYLDEQVLYLITNSSMLGFKNTNCESIVNYQDFISLRIGSVIQKQDIYILSKQYLYIRYPGLTNVQKIDITEPFMTPVAFTITRDYIIVQMANQTVKQAILKVYRILNYNPKLIDIVEIDYSQVLYGTQNYLEAADYMFLFTTSNNSLSAAYYQGLQLIIDPIGNFDKQRKFQVAVVNYDKDDTKFNQTLFIYITVYGFNNPEYIVDFQQLTYTFQDSFVKIPLRDGIIGPSVEFYTFDQVSLDMQFLNGMFLINMQKPLNYQQSVQNIIGIMLEREKQAKDIIRFKYAFKNPSNNLNDSYINLYDCYLSFYISVFEVQRCNNLTNKFINQSLIKLQSMKGFFYIQNTSPKSSEEMYLLYDSDHILMCNDSICTEKTNLELKSATASLKAITTTKGPIIIRLRQDAKSLTILTLNQINKPIMNWQLQIDSRRLVDLDIQNVSIVDYYTDLQFKSILVVQLSNSKVYVMQKQYNNMDNILVHITNIIKLGDIPVCTKFHRTFFITKGSPSKLIILCQNRTLYHLVQFKINNPFDVQKSREYPLYDYQINPKSELHFSDNQFIYIAATNNKINYYLVYNPLQITPNVLINRIPSQSYYHLTGELKNQIQKKGYGMVDKWAFIVADSYYEGQLDLKKYTENVSRDVASFAVRNHKDQLDMVQFKIVVNLTQSKLNYNLNQSQYILESNVTDLQMSIDLTNLSGPVSTVDIETTCLHWPVIKKKEILEMDKCLRNEDDILLGKFLSYASLRTKELVVTTQRILCIANRSIINHVNEGNRNCTLKDFSSPTQQQALIYCQWYSTLNFRIIKISEDCTLSFSNVSRPNNVSYFNVMAQYPLVLLEVPILLQQNKNYYTCVFDQNIRRFKACNMLINGLQLNFLSTDFDIMDGMGLILEKGVGVYNLLSGNNRINPQGWITQQVLINHNIPPPYKYAKIISTAANKNLINVEIANKEMTFEFQYNFKDIKIYKIYQKYIDCVNINVKSIQIDKYKVKICEFLKPSIQLLDETLLFQKYPEKLIQFYLKDSFENHPVSMFYIGNTSNFYVSQNYLLQTTPELQVCYYHINQNISWILGFDIANLNSSCQCSHNLVIKNNHYSTKINLTFALQQQPSKSLVPLYVSHIPFIILLLSFPFVRMWGKKIRKLPQTNYCFRKKSYNKNFYSNDFEDNLKNAKQHLIQNRI